MCRKGTPRRSGAVLSFGELARDPVERIVVVGEVYVPDAAAVRNEPRQVHPSDDPEDVTTFARLVRLRRNTLKMGMCACPNCCPAPVWKEVRKFLAQCSVV